MELIALSEVSSMREALVVFKNNDRRQQTLARTSTFTTSDKSQFLPYGIYLEQTSRLDL